MENTLEDISKKAIEYAVTAGCNYCDVRAEIYSKQGFVIENNTLEYSTSKVDHGIGIRVLNQGSWGFFSISNPVNLAEIKTGVEKAAKAALHYSSKKKEKIKLADTKTIKEKINFPVKTVPSIDKLIQIGFDCDKIIHQNRRIIKSQVNTWFNVVSKVFLNSEGSEISQNFTDTITELTATAHENGLTQSVNVTEGGRGGIEKLSSQKDIMETSKNISDKASQLIDAKPVKDDRSKVVLNPDFVALLTHEILGHPSEADRVLGKEMAWAGGAWWAGKLNEKIGSDLLNVFDDPSIDGTLGHYRFDDEGNEANRTELIKNGRLSNHMQSRETAEIFHQKVTANMRASSYRFMPLIRMACTCIDRGEWNPDEMISDTKNGYLISNMKVPSIDMKRCNWSISCQFAHKIENGEITDLLRDVIVLGTAPDFFNSIDACGKDFTIRPIINCGKGDPMQSMIMGNGGPSIRATATIRSA